MSRNRTFARCVPLAGVTIAAAGVVYLLGEQAGDRPSASVLAGVTAAALIGVCALVRATVLLRRGA